MIHHRKAPRSPKTCLILPSLVLVAFIHYFANKLPALELDPGATIISSSPPAAAAAAAAAAADDAIQLQPRDHIQKLKDLTTLPVLEWMESPLEREYIARIHALPPTPPSELRVISFGLYGDNPKYTQGAVRNAELRDTYFPGWICRFYVDSTVPQEIVVKLKELGAQVLTPPTELGGSVAGMFWRFLVADDLSVGRFIVRDSDSRLNARDRFAVEDWINSGKSVHVLRDHVNHVRTMNGGLWGGKGGCVIDANGGKGGIFELMKSGKWAKMDAYMQDIHLLTDQVWPLIKDDQIGHDAYSCSKFLNSKPFPVARDPNYQHVGQVFDAQDRPRMDDIDHFIRGRANPKECRPVKHQDWIHG